MDEIPWFRNGRLAWATDEMARDEQTANARQLEGMTITRVRYFTLDYGQLDHAGLPNGPRIVVSEGEWEIPSWRYNEFESVDFYIEIETEERRTFTIGWDPPSSTEGLWMHEGVTRGEPFASGAPVALWDVTNHGQWSNLVGSIVTSVTPRYRHWDQPAGFACDLVTLIAGDQALVVFLGGVGEHLEMVPAPNNLLTISAGTRAPEWLAL
jgi:hypothetical protein